jgi:hypothetical protein
MRTYGYGLALMVQRASSPLDLLMNSGRGKTPERELSTSDLEDAFSGVSDSSYLVDPASSHMLVSKIKPCMSKYKQICTVKLRMAH